MTSQNNEEVRLLESNKEDLPLELANSKESQYDTSSKDAPSKEIPFTVFDHGERVLLIFILSLIGWWSTVSSPIYFPALTSLTEAFHVSSGLMNVSLVSYLLLQGIAPTLCAAASDAYGRRPIILFSLLVYVAACIGISQTNAFWLLVVLRCVQAAGVAPVIAISSGVSADVCTAATRGGFVGLVGGGQVLGNGFGSLIGAALMSRFHTWRAIFVFLAIGGGCTFVATFFILSETNRLIVGNGSIPPKNWVYRSVFLYLPYFKKRLTNDMESKEPVKKPDILSPFKLLFRVEIILTLLPVGFIFTAWTLTLASMGSELQSRYKYSIMHVGLIYLPQGIACLLSTIVTGRLLNMYYAYRKGQHDKLCESLPEEERPFFNIMKVRLDLLIIPGFLLIAGLIIFGWCIQFKQPVISVIISSVLISFASGTAITCTTTLLVDLAPGRGSSATSSINFVRCMLAAAGVGALDAMTAAMGLGGTYTFLAGLCLASLVLLYTYVMIYSKELNCVVR